MLECPACKTSYKEKVNTCKICSLSEDDIHHIKEINLNHPILITCIPTLVNKLRKYEENNYQTQALFEISKLNIKVQNFITEQKQDRQEFETLKKTVKELESKIQSKHNNHNLDSNTQENLQSSTQIQLLESIGHTPSYLNSRDCSNIEDQDRNNIVFAPDDLQVDNNHSDLVAPQESDLHIQTGQGEFSQTIDAQIPYFVETYNRDKNLSNEFIISAVIETQESMENRLAVVSKAIFLSNTNKGKYWIVEENSQYFLVPHAKININEHNKYTIKNLFECNELSSGDYNFQLIQPAKVSKIDSGLWKLEKKGKLEFS